MKLSNIQEYTIFENVWFQKRNSNDCDHVADDAADMDASSMPFDAGLRF